jgi:exopolyphosphatase / guanosine-5'-triphosphate,3'-diphosphate pyrophosphatase
MLLAAIDIGTNAVRLYFSNAFNKNGQIVVEKASLLRIPIRLGEDVFTGGYISEEKRNNLLKTMQAFKLLIEVYKPVAWKVCATAAMREAVNQQEIIELISKETGVRIEVIDGIQEANLVGALGNQYYPVRRKYVMFVDVGGGSTEISLLKGDKHIASGTFKIGTVRLLKDAVETSEWVSMKKWLKSLKVKKNSLLLIGSGGNINKITKLYGKLPENLLSIERLDFALNDLEKYSLDERIQQIGMRPDRADVIIPAGRIFQCIMQQIKADVIYVPKIGLSDGMIVDMFREYSKN